MDIVTSPAATPAQIREVASEWVSFRDEIETWTSPLPVSIYPKGDGLNQLYSHLERLAPESKDPQFFYEVGIIAKDTQNKIEATKWLKKAIEGAKTPELKEKALYERATNYWTLQQENLDAFSELLKLPSLTSKNRSRYRNTMAWSLLGKNPQLDKTAVELFTSNVNDKEGDPMERLEAIKFFQGKVPENQEAQLLGLAVTMPGLSPALRGNWQIKTAEFHKKGNRWDEAIKAYEEAAQTLGTTNTQRRDAALKDAATIRVEKTKPTELSLPTFEATFFNPTLATDDRMKVLVQLIDIALAKDGWERARGLLGNARQFNSLTPAHKDLIALQEYRIDARAKSMLQATSNIRKLTSPPLNKDAELAALEDMIAYAVAKKKFADARWGIFALGSRGHITSAQTLFRVGEYYEAEGDFAKAHETWTKLLPIATDAALKAKVQTAIDRVAPKVPTP